MKVVITGANGFVGHHLARHLHDIGHTVIGVIRSKRQNVSDFPSGIEVLECDLTEIKTFEQEFEVLIHCAAEIPNLCPDPTYLFERNVNINRKTFEAALTVGVTKFIFCSSMSVFGKISVEEVSPNTPICEPDDYGKAKFLGEVMLDEIASRSAEICAVSLRLPGVVGVGSHDNFLSAFVNNLFSGNAIKAQNPDALFNNILPISNLCSFVELLTSSMPTGHRILTLAASQPAPIRRVLEEVQSGAATNVPVSFGEKSSTFLISSDAAGAMGYKSPDTLAAARHFGKISRESLFGG